MISTKDLAWVAGFLEGEGTFYITGASYPVIQCPQNQLEPLERLRSLVGGDIYARKIGARHDWHLRGKSAIALMMTIYCMMSPWRKAKISQCIAVWKLAKKPGGGVGGRSKYMQALIADLIGEAK